MKKFRFRLAAVLRVRAHAETEAKNEFARPPGLGSEAKGPSKESKLAGERPSPKRSRAFPTSAHSTNCSTPWTFKKLRPRARSRFSCKKKKLLTRDGSMQERNCNRSNDSVKGTSKPTDWSTTAEPNANSTSGRC